MSYVDLASLKYSLQKALRQQSPDQEQLVRKAVNDLNAVFNANSKISRTDLELNHLSGNLSVCTEDASFPIAINLNGCSIANFKLVNCPQIEHLMVRDCNIGSFYLEAV